MKKGITLLEIIISMAILVILLVITIRAMNPGGQIAMARNSQRSFHVTSILNAIRSNLADTRTGTFICANGDLPTSTKKMASGAGNYDIASCLIPNYLNILPFDPSASSSYWTDLNNYNTGYNLIKNSSSGAITVSAPFAELGKTISVTR